ncbi:MAG: hypothetical protein C4583_19215 [Anaerolineaceae bacterium]|nr:MAG: hypothetical protein C4583_19215 [Anaerolineaceae bacterium]
MNLNSSDSNNQNDFEHFDIKAALESAQQQEIKEASDRNHAIVSGVDLEEALGELLFNYMVDDKPSRDLLRTTLSNFATRINMAYSLGLISQDEFADLHTMREIRNYFAHGKRGCTFADKYVTDLCDKLKIPKKNPIEMNEPWTIYLSTAIILLEILSDRIWYAKKHQNETPKEIDPPTWADL